MGSCIVTILASCLMLWIFLDLMSAAQEMPATLESGTTKGKTKIVNFDHDGDQRQEFTAYANFFSAEDVSFVARRPSEECLDADARINKVVVYFGDHDCSTIMMWGKSGFFWGRGDLEMMSHLPKGEDPKADVPKDVHVSLTNKNVYLIGDYTYRDDTEIFVCPVNQSITTIGFLFEKGPVEALPEGCEITISLDDLGFVDEADIGDFTPPPTTTVLTTLPTTTTVLTTLPTTTTVPTTVLSTSVITKNSHTTKDKTTKTVTITTPKDTTLNTTKTDTTVHSTENGTSKNSTPNAHNSTLSTKKTHVDVIGVGSTTKIDNGAGESGPWAVIHIGLLLIIALY